MIGFGYYSSEWCFVYKFDEGFKVYVFFKKKLGHKLRITIITFYPNVYHHFPKKENSFFLLLDFSNPSKHYEKKKKNFHSWLNYEHNC